MNKILRLRNILELLRFTPFDVSTDVGRSYERYRLIALSSSSSIIAKILISLIGLVSVPFTINYLGKEQFGLWMVVSSLVIWSQLADFGISNGLVNALAEAHGREDRVAARSYISTAFVSLSIISFIGIPLIVFLSYWIPWNIVFNISNPSFVAISGKCFLAAGLVSIFGLPASAISRIYIAYQLSYINNIILIISSLISFFGLLISIYMKLSLPWLVVLVSSAPLIGNLIAWLLMHRFLPWCRIELKWVNVHSLKRISHSSTPLFIYQIGALLVSEMINIILAQVSSLNMVADYNILLKIYLFIFSIGVSLSSPFYPAIREAFEKKETVWVMHAIFRVTMIRVSVLIIPSLLLLFIGDLLIYYWIHQTLDSSFGIIGWSVFSAALLLSTLSSTLGEILISLDDIWSLIKIVFLSSAVIIFGVYYLVSIFQLSGVYIAVSVSTIYPIYWSWKRIKNKLPPHIA